MLIVCLSTACWASVSCTSSESPPLPVPSGDAPAVPPAPAGRRLCIALTPAPGEISLDGAFDTAVDLGMREPGDINLDWSSLEPEPGRLVDPDGQLAYLNDLYSSMTSATLTLAPIQSTYVTVPSDLAERPWNDPALIDRYLETLDAVLGALDRVPVRVVSVGNEVDALLDRPDELARYAELVRAVNDHLEPRGIAVGSKLTREGVLSPALEPILSASDLAIVSYYPLGDGHDPWRARSPSLVADEIDRLVAHLAPKPVYLAEVGYPSAEAIGGSGEAQADFVDAIFDSWDRHETLIRGLCFVWLHDLSAEVLDGLATRYGVDADGFVAYLGSLGIHDERGRPKPAAHTLRRRAARL